MEPTVTPARPLPYADLPARYGIQYDVRPDGCLIVLPPPPWWQRLEVVAPLVVILLVFGPQLADAVAKGRTTRAVVVGAVAVGVACAAVVSSWRRRSVVFEVTGSALRSDNVRPLFRVDGGGARTLRYPRGDVYDVQFIEHSGHLLVRVRGREMLELKPSTDPRVVRWLAEELRRALGLPA